MKLLFLASVWLSVFFINVKSEADPLKAIFSDPKFKPNSLGNAIPGRYIIEFDEHYRGSSMEFINEVESDIIKSEPYKRVKMNVAHDYSSPAIFRGVSISLKNNQSLNKRSDGLDQEIPDYLVLRKVLQQHQVKHIYPVTEIPRPTVKRHAHVSAYDATTITELPEIIIPENGSPLPFTHQATQVDKVHKSMKAQGNGIIVGIIDTGIDYLHPAFGSGFGPGFPVQYGYDLVGDNFNSMNLSSISENSTPLDTCEEGGGHGTHVAGIIAANDRLLNFTGVAPNATLGVWRIFGCSGSTSNDLVIKALINAHEAGCNVINLSLGTASNWADDPTSLVANRISERGSIVVAAAGNDGGDGAFYISAPGSGKSTISVASVDNSHSLTPAFQVENGDKYSYTLSTSTTSFLEGTLVAYSNSTLLDDACNEKTPDGEITGRIVLVQRGTCTLDEKVRNIQSLGALAVVIYDNQSEKLFRPRTYTATIPVISISLESGESILRQLKEKGVLEITCKMILIPQKVPTSGQVSGFSSIGPLFDLSLKPDIAAPGGYVFSTLPLANGGYGVLSGTSMASPFVTGALALFMETHGKNMTHMYIKEHFQNYAQPIPQDSPIHQGAGLIQVSDAIGQPIHVSPGHLSFNDTSNIQPQTLVISNPSDKTVTFAISHFSGMSMTHFFLQNQNLVPLSPSRATTQPITAILDFSAKNVTLEAGQSTALVVQVVSILGNAQEEPFPIYGGYIQLVPQNSVTLKTIHVPYVGVRGALSQAPIFAPGFPKALSGEDTRLFERRLDEDAPLEINRALSSKITIMYRLLTGTFRLQTEVLDDNMEIIGIASDDHYVPRNTLSNYVFMDLWNGTMIPLGTGGLEDLQPVKDGSYYLRWKALKLLSNPLVEESWESQLSPLILVH